MSVSQPDPLLPVLRDDELSERTAAVFADIRATRNTDFVNNIWRVLANDPPLLEQTWAEVKGVLGADGELDVLTKQLIYIAVSVAQGCNYCIRSHTAAARNLGLTDAQVAADAGVNIIFAPSVDEMYPEGEPLIRISSGELGDKFEGITRPGHFDGVLTVVNKLFNIVRPAAGSHEVNAYFGQKDAQQVLLVQRMIHDFNHDITLRPVAIVRDDDGLALSSRNEFLSEQEREAALVISRTLALMRENSLNRGFESIDLESARARINSTEGVRLDYLELVDPSNFQPPTADSERVLALVAAYVGSTRLIDNMDLL